MSEPPYIISIIISGKKQLFFDRLHQHNVMLGPCKHIFFSRNVALDEY
ncbi:hypothetical protein GP2143_13031 [marine gamma proteobacterium HTCC2143]|uniref:Uncharacterized protein n=1 Tax=marine gamma proteobacterium HTCC2143 TaxID=247633 RepID=A0Y7S6_9GAMM|nr:hypothetical protein GP2143_13031 [marine gamma proteobacterium HTCC2143]